MKFELGQVVEVVDTGSGYTSYEAMAEKMGLDKFVCFDRTSEGQTGKVVAQQPHPDFADNLYGVLIGDKQFILGEKGLGAVVQQTEKKIPLKTDWSFGGSVSDREAVKALCLVIGFEVPPSHTKIVDWDYVASSRFGRTSISYSDMKRATHFTDLGKLVCWLLDEKAELRALLEQKLKEVEELTAQIAA